MINCTDIITNTIGGLVGGGTVAVALQYYLNKREKKKEETSKIASSKTLLKRVTSTIFSDLKPGKSVEQMKDLLGTYTKKDSSDVSVFSENAVKTNSYLYMVSNACIKITSKDDITIDSLTIFPYESEIHLDEMANMCDENETRFNVMKVCQNLIDASGDNATHISTRTDRSFALKTYIPNPLYLYYTYFGFLENAHEYYESKDSNKFLGGVINGVCISNDPHEAFFIYDQEMR